MCVCGVCVEVAVQMATWNKDIGCISYMYVKGYMLYFTRTKITFRTVVNAQCTGNPVAHTSQNKSLKLFRAQFSHLYDETVGVNNS